MKTMNLFLLIVGFFAMSAGCAAPEERPLPADHPASADAPETPVPPPSRTLDVRSADPIRRPVPALVTPTSTAHDHGAHRDHAADVTPTAAPAKEQTKAIYTCPMDPEVVSDQPGRCPKCGMKLEPKDEGGKQ